MKPFLATVLTGFLLTPGLIYWADPAHRWHRFSIFAVRDLRPGENWVWSSENIDEADLKITHLKLIRRPDLVFMGSSRVTMVDSGMFSHSIRFFNAGISSAMSEDYIIYWQMLKELNKTPTYLVLFADPWILNKYTRNTSWQRNSRYVEALDPVYHQRRSWSQIIHLLSEDIPELFNLTAFAGAMTYITQGRREEAEARKFIVDETRVPPDRKATRWDGSLHYPRKITDPLPLEEIHKLALRTMTVHYLSGFTKWGMNRRALESLHLLLRDAENHRVSVMIITPPYQPAALDMIKETGHQEVLDQFVSALESLKVQHPNLIVCKALDPADSNCSETEFWDGMHMQRSCTQKVIQRCFARSPGWKALLAL